MKRLALLAVLILAGCGYFEGASVRDVSTMVLYRAERKVLIFVATPCAAHDGKPALVSAWVREKNVGQMVVLCDSECNCRFVKRTPAMRIAAPRSDTGICR